MSKRAETKIFGMRLGVDPKILTGGLIVVALLLFWFNTRSDDEGRPPSSTTHRDAATPATPVHSLVSSRARREQTTSDRGTLRLRPIDPTRGDVDPTLRLDLLARLQTVQLASGGRSLFEAGPPPLTPEQKKLLDNAPRIPRPAPTPPPPVIAQGPVEQPLNIPLKYYGFVKSGRNNQANEGLFLDGDNVVVGSEGELVLKKYLIVALTPTSARLEDPQLKKGQTLPVVPAAVPAS